MNEEIQRGIEESRKINTIIEDVKVPGGLDKIRMLFGRKKIPSDIPVLSEFVHEYFEPAQKMHERGDYSGAVHVYERAVEKGSQLGCFVLSQYYLHGLGVERNVWKYNLLLKLITRTAAWKAFLAAFFLSVTCQAAGESQFSLIDSRNQVSSAVRTLRSATSRTSSTTAATRRFPLLL